MSGVEIVLGTVACVAAVVSAYRDGGTIIQKIKVKRSQKRAAPPSRLLEESVDQAPTDIEREKQRGLNRFGKAFEEGDHIAVIALQQITIKLQSSLLEELRNAAFDDAVTDFRYLVDVADAGRDKTMNTLIELRQRLLAAEPLGNDLSPTSTLSIAPPNGKQRTSLPLPAPPSLSPSTNELRQTQTWAQSNHAISRDASGEEDAGSGAENIPRKPGKHRSSLLGIFRHRTASHGGGSGMQTPTAFTEGVAESPRPSSPVHAPPPRTQTDARSSISAGSSHSQQTVATTWDYQPWEAKIWGAKQTSSSPEQAAHDRPQSASPPMPRQSVAPTTTTFNRTSSIILPTPIPENSYLGFCKNAVRLQNGDRSSFEKCAEHAYSRSGYSSTTIYYLSCKSTKCSYMSQLKADTIWERVWTDPELGIKWRWPFLAKSHVQQKQVKGQQFSYQCIFCTFANGKGAVFHGSRMYLKHVASHRGEMGEVLKYKASCINDHICDDDEEFDVNLYPLEPNEKRDREQSTVLSDELMGLGLFPPKPEPADSMFSNEPWNEGLSNFHYGGDVDRTELE